MRKIFITVSGTSFKYGTESFERGDVVTLEKDTKNEFDTEAIKVKMEGIGQIGWVANSVSTVMEDCFSAGRIYDSIGDTAQAKVRFVAPAFLVCQIDEDSFVDVPKAWLGENEER